jgi:hypothetical protein
LARIAEVRGNAYTEFLRSCKQRLTTAGKQMRYNLQVDWLRPDRPRERALAYPAHLDWQWERWINEGLMDAAILRFFEFQPDFVLADDFTRRVLEACQARQLPITWNRYIGFAGDHLAQEALRIRQDGRFSGFILYETSAYIQLDAQGGASVSSEPVRQVRPALES